MVINPPIGAEKAWENTRPQLQGGVESILNSLGLKSILDLFSHPDVQNVIIPALGMALGGTSGGSTMNAPWSFAGPASKWPQTTESAGKVLMPFKEQPNLVDLFLDKRLNALTDPKALSPTNLEGATVATDDLTQIMKLLGMK